MKMPLNKSIFKHIRLFILIFAAILLSGCTKAYLAVGPDYEKPEMQLPEQWKTTVKEKTDADLSQWWKQFNDPYLDRLIAEALEQNHDLRLAQSRVRQARATTKQSISGLFPTVSIGGDASTNHSDGVTRHTSYSAGFDASWEIDIFGGTRRGIEASYADEAASEANLNNAKVTLLAEVALNYIELRTYQQLLRVAKSNLATQTETQQITEWRYQAGLASSTEVEQSITIREQTRASIPDIEIGLRAAENRMAVLLGRQPSEIDYLANTPQEFPEIPKEVALLIPNEAITNRPDIVSSERKLAAETARIGQKLAQRFPSLRLGGHFGWQAYALSGLGAAGSLVRSLVGSLAMTIFDGGRLRAEVEIQNAVQEQALIQYEKSVLTALEEIENALYSYAQGRERLDARTTARDAAQNAATLARDLYQSGLIDFQKVLDTERSLLTAEESLVRAQASMRTDLIKLYKTLGGGWDTELPEKETPPTSEKTNDTQDI